MTIRDAEVIELLADKPELLAIADAVSATRRKLGEAPRRRRVAVRAAIVLAVAAAVLAAVLAAPQGGPSGVLGRALAAVGDGPIIHVVTEMPSGGAYVNLKTGHRTAQIFREELWADRKLDRFHLVLSVNGRVVGDLLWPADAREGVSPIAPENPAFVALWTGYRNALKDGTVTLAGRGDVDGRRIYWLRFNSASNNEEQNEVAVDARTYEPVLYRYSFNGRHVDQRIVIARTTAYRASEFKRRGPSLAGGSTSEGGMSPAPYNPSAPPPAVVRAPWLTAGKAVGGLKLQRALPSSAYTTVKGKRTTFKGFELTYGTRLGAGGPRNATTVDEYRRPPDSNEWRFIPAGSVQIQTGEESGSGGTHTTWTGNLKKDGIYLTISTPKSERALLAIARALRVGRK
jgi:hypothetical protein